MSGRVLVVDDSKVIRQLIRVNLELEGFEVVTAADGVECLDIVQRVRPDVITLDAVMPRLDGMRTVDRLRSDPRTCHIPVALITACTQFEGQETAAIDAFLAKPFEPAELVRLVRRLSHGVGNGAGSGAVCDVREGHDGEVRAPGLPHEPPAAESAEAAEPTARPVR
ncbi:response regulator [Streptomyces daliensis]|uniref:Response regulator n=1 Tax=Streptomyces daliensis TaxID=299421 RepID=A0A8T4IRI3_9ACTN|nr:response regulator [Streptomyces daliensis]